MCATHSRAYLHHLTKTQETLGWTLIGQHNIHFYHQLMREIRASILEDRFLPLYHEKRAILAEEDLDHPVKPPKRGQNSTVSEIGQFELHSSSIRHLETGAVVPTEIREELPELVKLLKAKHETPVIVLDEGLGAGAAALSSILIYEGLAQTSGEADAHRERSEGSGCLAPRIDPQENLLLAASWGGGHAVASRSLEITFLPRLELEPREG